ncbi:FUSC family protein [Hymenobacter taeanensis]|uniref:FUSC family protein n=1 Tax=Hymenobacter taeanensis TaxID=2735321 RepID=A0A6M6BHE1_9BACT|nr:MULTISPECIES: FUSC family protein [Hymenobacter]QJX47607.1 FUSC family protein [Hymenobacter taeanensis]UOQ82910.1 FUSC family protein [Hymenobacter sp. 5414T-23]
MKLSVARYVPRTRRAVRSLVKLHDAPWRWKVGLEASLAIGLPVAVFTLAGNQAWGLQAALGSFTALYGASLSRQNRALLLPFVAAGLVLAAALGIACAGNEWLPVACLVLVSALASTLVLGFRLGPPGPMMFVLVAAVSGHIAAPAALDGAGQPGLRLLGLVAAGAGLAYFVVVMPLLIPGRRYSASVGLGVLLPRLSFDRDTAAVALRVVVAVLIASLVARPLGAHRVYWVVLSAVAVLQSSPSRQLTGLRAVHRVVGTLLGIGLFELLSLLHPIGLGLVAALMLLQGATEVVVARNYAFALLFITPIALLNATAGHAGNTLVTVEGRVLDTLLGAGIALVLFWFSELLLRPRHDRTAA